MKKITLGIVFGGNTSEYPVSLHSVSSVIRNLNKDRYDTILIGIDREGVWYYYNGDVDTLERDEWKTHPSTRRASLSASKGEGLVIFEEDGCRFQQIDCLLPILHGKNGEDGSLQGLFELSQIPYVGCNHVSSGIAMDKEFTHIICEAQGIPMAPYISVLKDTVNYDEVLEAAKAKLKLPLFVKPANEGSSFGISKIETFEELESALKFAFKYDKKVIVENGIDGFEVGCAVLGNNDLIVGEVDEIDTKKHFFDYDAKYELENTQILCPARIDDEIRDEVRLLAKKIFRVLGCSGLSRVDMFLSSDKKIYFNEINTIPGFTAASRYPTMMKEAGMDFTTLIDKLVDLAME